MSSAPDVPDTEPPATAQRDLSTLLLALVVAVVAARVVGAVVHGGGVTAPVLQVLVSDLAVWVPLAAAVLVIRRHSGATDRGLLRIALPDVVFAIGIVITTRVFDVVLSLAFTGSTGLVPAPALGTPDVGLLVVSAVGVVLVSPLLEEVFFRGLFQRRVAAGLTPRTRWLAVVLTALLFALAHLFLGAAVTPLGGLQVFLTTFVLGASVGSLVAMTDRIGGAVLAHALFNAVAVAATWPR